MGVQKIDSEEFKNLSTFDKIVGRRAYIGGELGNIRTLPRTQTETKFLESPTGYIKETAQSPEFLGSALVIIPAVISGVKGIYTSYKAGGIKGAFLDTASAISPIKIKEGIYAPRVDSSTKLNVESIKYTDKSGLTTRIFSGKDIYGDIKVGGVEQYKLVNGKAVGMGYLSTETPYINIQYGGAQVTTGVRSTLQPYVYGSTGGGTASINTILGNSQLSALITEQLSVQSGKSNLWVSKGIDIYSGEEGVSIYSNLNKFVKVNSGGISEVGTETGITKFISGQTKPIYETLVDETGFIYRPSGKYELSPSVYGTEYDLNVLFRNAYGNTYRISGGGASSSGGVSGSSALNSLQTQTGQSLNLPVNIPKVISTPSTTPTILLPKPEVKQTTQNVPTFSTQVKLQTPELLTDTKVATDVKVDVGVKNLVTNLQIPELKSKSKTAQIVAPVSVASQVQVPVANQIQRIIQVQKLSLKQASAQTALSPAFAFPSASTFADIIPTNDYIPVLPLSFGGGFEERALKIARIPSAPSGRDYTPSFSALFFKISGKTKKTGKTGLEFRPITKGFNLNKFLGGGNRVIKVRRVKI